MFPLSTFPFHIYFAITIEQYFGSKTLYSILPRISVKINILIKNLHKYAYTYLKVLGGYFWQESECPSPIVSSMFFTTRFNAFF